MTYRQQDAVRAEEVEVDRRALEKADRDEIAEAASAMRDGRAADGILGVGATIAAPIVFALAGLVFGALIDRHNIADGAALGLFIGGAFGMVAGIATAAWLFFRKKR